ncbi:MAG: ANTAR domain-containing protein [Oscillospiraceae bacterium]|jgi:response regulator NasT|nr:ANTAR domain-containing protein [Oscillospiraceae bacterium]
MPRFLLVSGSEKGGQTFGALLRGRAHSAVCVCVSAAQALELLQAEAPFDFCVLNAPLADETGLVLAKSLAEQTQAQILALVAQEQFDAFKEHLTSLGVLLLQKPVSRQVLLSSLDLMQAVQTRLALVQTQNRNLERQINEMKLINRAKCVLISNLGMSEAQAHKHMERQAMNQRVTKHEVAVNVLKLYEDRH